MNILKEKAFWFSVTTINYLISVILFGLTSVIYQNIIITPEEFLTLNSWILGYFLTIPFLICLTCAILCHKEYNKFKVKNK